MNKLACALVALMVTPMAFAGHYNYTFVDLGYVRAESGATAVSEGVEIEGSWEFSEGWVADIDYIDGSNDTTEIEIGGAYVMDAGSHIDLITRVNYTDGEVGTTEFDGFGVDLGIRGMLGEAFEYTVGHSYRSGDIEVGATDVSFNDHFTTVGLLKHLSNSNMSVGVDAELNDATSVYNVFGRYNF